MPTVYILVLPRRVNNIWPAGITKAEVSPSLFTPLSHHYRRVYPHHTKFYNWSAVDLSYTNMTVSPEDQILLLPFIMLSTSFRCLVFTHKLTITSKSLFIQRFSVIQWLKFNKYLWNNFLLFLNNKWRNNNTFQTFHQINSLLSSQNRLTQHHHHGGRCRRIGNKN